VKSYWHVNKTIQQLGSTVHTADSNINPAWQLQNVRCYLMWVQGSIDAIYLF